MDASKVKDVLQYLNEKYDFLESLQGQETTLKDIVKAEILAIEITLKTLKIDFESRSCWKCCEPETFAIDELGRCICEECMMQE